MKKNNFAVKILIVALIMTFMGCGAAFAAVPEVSDSFYAADYADVLSQETEEYIVEKNGIIENLSGAQIVVAAVDFLDGMDIEDYAYKMFNDWKIGDEDKNNGVLLLLVIGEENYWCMQGKGLEKVLTSGDIDDILWDNLEPDFAAADYDEGVKLTFDALYNELYEYYGGDYDFDSSFDGIIRVIEIGLIIFAIIVILLVILGIFAIKKNIKKTPNWNSGPDWNSGNSGNSNPWNPTKRTPTNYPSSPRPVIFPLMGGMTSRPRRRTTTTNSQSGGFGSLFGGGSSHSSFGGGSSHGHSSFGGGGRGIGRGGGGMSRGGGAGRRH